jgi:hypothetical protein
LAVMGTNGKIKYEREREWRERDPSFYGSASMSQTLIDFNVATTKRKGIVSEIS